MLPSLLVLLAGACGPSVPPLPSVKSDNLNPAVKEAVEEAVAKAAEIERSATLSGKVGMILQAHDVNDQAVAWYQRARALDPGAPAWPYYQAVAEVAQGRGDVAMLSVNESLELGQYEPAELLKARLLMDADKSEEACPIFERLKSIPGLAPAAWLGVGRCRSDSGDHEGAVEAYSTAIEIYPRFGAAWFGLAEALADSGKQEESERAKARAALVEGELPPLADPRMDQLTSLSVSPEAFIGRAQNFAMQGRLEDAVGALKRAAEIDPTSAQPWNNLIGLYAQAGEPELAKEAYDKAIQVDPANAEAHYNYGVLLMRTEKPEEAAEAFKDALEISPENPQSRMSYGLALEVMGDTAGALEQIGKAIESQPNYREALFHAGRLEAERGRFQAAVAHLEKTREPVDQQTPQFLYLLAMSQGGAGQMTEARKTLAEARDLAVRFGQKQIVDEIDARIRGDR